MINTKTKIYLAGHKGLVGSAILKKFQERKFRNIITIEKKFLDLRNQNEVDLFIKSKKPEVIIIAAARVGGITANYSYQGEFIYENLMIQTNLINAAKKNKIKNLIFFGSSCIYPKYSKQPIKEEYLLSGKLEETNQAYAIAKIAGIQMCSSYNFQFNTQYKCLMPTNTFGENDNYNLDTSHFYPAIISKLFKAKKYNKNKIYLYGTGAPKRELIYVGDIADACYHFLKHKTKETLINIGTGTDYTIKYYANFLKNFIHPKCEIVFDSKYPNGTPRKLLDISLAKKYKWSPKISLSEGTSLTISDFLKKEYKKL